MTVDSLEELKTAFGEWRSRKLYAHEKTPRELLKRALEATKRHGLSRVVRELKIHKRQLKEPFARSVTKASEPRPSTRLSYSKVELVGATALSHPFAELEMPSGIKLRLFSPTRETLGLLSSVCVAGGAR